MSDFNTNIHDAAYEAAADFLGDYKRGFFPNDEVAAVEMVAMIISAMATAADRNASTYADEYPEDAA